MTGQPHDFGATPAPQKRGAVARGLSLFATDKRARVAQEAAAFAFQHACRAHSRATLAAWFALGAWIAAGLALAVSVAGRGS